MAENKGLLSRGWGMVRHNKRYIFWFWLLNLTLAWLGTAAFRNQAEVVLDHSLFSNGLVQGFQLAPFIEMLSRPEFGPTSASSGSAFGFAILFSLLTALFLPGVFQGYASNYRLPRDEFFRACGRNLWRFVRLLIVAVIVMGIVSGVLFSIHAALVKKAGDSTNELLPFEVGVMTLAIIFLVVTVLRIWFDLAEADVVLNDQNAVRKSIRAAFRHTFRGLWRLLGSYVLITIVAGIILLGGIAVWVKFVPPDRILRAFLVGQVTLFLLLIPRFWQRSVAVAYWQQKMLVPVLSEPVIPAVPVSIASEPPASEPPIAIPSASPAPDAT
jgi:hypothetical protein